MGILPQAKSPSASETGNHPDFLPNRHGFLILTAFEVTNPRRSKSEKKSHLPPADAVLLPSSNKPRPKIPNDGTAGFP